MRSPESVVEGIPKSTTDDTSHEEGSALFAVQAQQVTSPEPKHPIKYRPDIDGLRTLAVVPVVLFHAYPHSIKGGFTGVDVFFVISGYLISGILFKENARSSFTYADFYSRRIRRIFPALLLVLTYTLVVGCVWLLDKALQSMAITLVAGTLFGANIQLLTVQQGYFDASVKENPLLHLWSLGVEEQFYIFWPLFVSVIHRLSFRKALACQLAVMVASFACNILFLGYGGENKYSFYFPLSRFWQMAVGGLLAYINLPAIGDYSKLTQHLTDMPTTHSVAFSVCGLAAIAVGYVVIDESMAFPGYWSLLPTLGTASLILAGPSTFINKYMLGNSAMTFIGQISYALYLWHWPLLVYAKLRHPVAPPFYMQPYSMVVLSVVLSIATLYLVENKLRRRKAKWLVPVLFGLMVLVSAMAVVVYFLPSTFSVISAKIEANRQDSGDLFVHPDVVPNWSRGPRQKNLSVIAAQAAPQDWHLWEGGYVHTDTTNAIGNDDGIKVLNGNATSAPLVVVLGDSHANMVAPRFAKLFQVAQETNQPFPQVMFRTFDGTPPLACIPWHAANVAFVQANKPKVVLISSNWVQFLRAGAKDRTKLSKTLTCCKIGYQDECENQSEADLLALVNHLENDIKAFVASGIKVFVATTNPEGEMFHPTKMLSGSTVLPTPPVSLAAFRQQHKVMVDLIEDATKAANATIIDFADNQCFQDVCEVVSMKEGEPVLKDSNHIRSYFARNYLTVLDQVVTAAMAKS
ncbi:hypothetical protein DYB30_011358 [Aphanomyces astaci]|uniref:Acyltransferase 3 domain-containing protein n=2 Tax=Aphanomyces astaci TaxID=112090 RepID=A0A397CMG5_APHAT|nr:hypothetical protein DYB30_011358 [Aphanomyces astaci]